MSTSQEGAPQLLRKAWPLESLSTKGYLVETPQGPPAQPRKWAKRNQEALCKRGVDPVSARLQGGN